MTAAIVNVQPLVDAIKAAVTASGVAFAEGRKPTVAAGAPYVVAFFDAGTVEDRSLRSRDGFSVYGSFQCAGLSPESARFAVRKLRAAVLGMFGREFDGRTVLLPVHEFPGPLTRDDDGDVPLFIQIDEWRVRLS